MVPRWVSKHTITPDKPAKPAKPAPYSPSLRGAAAAAAYLGMNDHQGRTFKKWAAKHHLRYSVVGDDDVRTYLKSDIDKLWADTAYNQPGQRAA